MGASHGKLTEITVATKDISVWTKTSNYERTAKTHDTTGYKPTGDAETYVGGLKSGKFTAGGWYDNTVSTGTRPALHGQEGVTQAIVRKIEGTGTGKPSDAFSAVLEKYVESSPHDDIVTWSAEWQITGPVTTTTQS